MPVLQLPIKAVDRVYLLRKLVRIYRLWAEDKRRPAATINSDAEESGLRTGTSGATSDDRKFIRRSGLPAYAVNCQGRSHQCSRPGQDAHFD